MSLLVIAPGLWTTIQDQGRPGYRSVGVPIGGAFDRRSIDVANALVGNEVDAAALEFTLQGGSFRAESELALAVAGADMPIRVIRRRGRKKALDLAPPCSFTVEAGDELRIGRVRVGARAYLAVAGGWQTPQVLGSRSREEPIRADTLLEASPGRIPVRRIRPTDSLTPPDGMIRIVAGPDAARSREGPAFWEIWQDRRFRVTSQSNRMGLRLENESGAALGLGPIPTDRLSAPIAPGAVQWTGDRLIVLGVACGTMGGYVHLAHVITVDLRFLAQLRPGDLIGFQPISVEEARAIAREDQQRRRAHCLRIACAARDRLNGSSITTWD